jgi:hydantoinase/carbamoylase family amidase
VISAVDLLRDIEAITATPGRGCTRLAYTHHEDAAHDLLWERLERPGLLRLRDAAGNLFVVPARAARGEPVVLVGSHLDTVLEGGRLDGALGVAVAAQVVDALFARPEGMPVGLVVFRDEEGVRFRTGLFGSKVFAGLCTERDLAATDADGIRVRDVVPDAAGCLAYKAPVRPAAYVECHIEQGIRLIERQRRIGIVTGMVGIRRVELVGEGAANHAGTTEMRRRVDALVPVAAAVARLPVLVEGLVDTVITCGHVSAEPGAPNIVPGTARALIEIRAADTATLDEVERRLQALIGDIQPPTPTTRLANLTLRPVSEVAPTATDASLGEELAGVLEERHLAFERLHSMAGHDAQHAAHVCKSSMFFIPSLDGISHSPRESSREEDIALAAEVMLAWAERCADAGSGKREAGSSTSDNR